MKIQLFGHSNHILNTYVALYWVAQPWIKNPGPTHGPGGTAK